VWSQEGEHHVLTGHLQLDCETLEEADVLRQRVRDVLTEAGIVHTTLEVTRASGDLPQDAVSCA
jgi:Co/Zn/Cd efflux system component